MGGTKACPPPGSRYYNRGNTGEDKPSPLPYAHSGPFLPVEFIRSGMIIFDAERPSDSPFVERVWRSHSEGASTAFLSTAESRCELVVTKLQGNITMTVRGAETKATSAGNTPPDGEWLGIRLKVGTFLSQLPAG